MAGILLLGTKKDRVCGIRALLREDGHEVVWHRQPASWAGAERNVRPEVIVATADFAAEVLATAGPPRRGFPAPLLFVHDDGHTLQDPFVPDRLVDRICSPFSREELLGRVDALARVQRVVHRRRDDSRQDEDPGAPDVARRYSGVGRRIRAMLGSRIPRYEKPLEPYLEVAARVAEWGDRRDAFQPGHQERVTSVCALIAEGLAMSDDDTAALLRAAMLHDIGKVALPIEVLHQRTPLEESQKRLIRTHPRRGAELLRALDQDPQVADAILCHHERPNGQGYYGRSAERTPVSGRALAVAEVFDAMTSSRLARPMAQDAALVRLEELKGEVFDADCVEALIDVLRPRPEAIRLTD